MNKHTLKRIRAQHENLKASLKRLLCLPKMFLSTVTSRAPIRGRTVTPTTLSYAFPEGVIKPAQVPRAGMPPRTLSRILGSRRLNATSQPITVLSPQEIMMPSIMLN
jgi:hypothetical protein